MALHVAFKAVNSDTWHEFHPNNDANAVNDFEQCLKAVETPEGPKNKFQGIEIEFAHLMDGDTVLQSWGPLGVVEPTAAAVEPEPEAPPTATMEVPEPVSEPTVDAEADVHVDPTPDPVL